MHLALSRNAGLATTAPRPSRRSPCERPVVARGFLQDVGAGFAQIFSPLLKNNKEDWTGTGTPFTGKIPHHSDPKKPFQDGWQAPQTGAEEANEAQATNVAAAGGQGPAAEGDVLNFLNKAAENVVAHNFTGDATEPEAWKGQGEKNPSGWKGEIHTRARDGFHTIN